MLNNPLRKKTFDLVKFYLFCVGSGLLCTSLLVLANATQATLATVAPGISEALIATAMGLFAAIPAVLAYNRLASRSDALLNRYETFLDEFSGILQRQTYALKANQSPRA